MIFSKARQLFLYFWLIIVVGFGGRVAGLVTRVGGVIILCGRKMISAAVKGHLIDVVFKEAGLLEGRIGLLDKLKLLDAFHIFFDY